jgi:hypothetical protein
VKPSAGDLYDRPWESKWESAVRFPLAWTDGWEGWWPAPRPHRGAPQRHLPGRRLRGDRPADEEAALPEEDGAGLGQRPDRADQAAEPALAEADTEADTATDPDHRAAALSRALDHYTGDLADRYYDEWVEPLRISARRQAADAASRPAEHLERDEPEKALRVLEAAAEVDRYNEDVYRRIMRIQARLRRPEAVRRTLDLVHARIGELDTEPDPQTITLAENLLRQAATH